MSTDLIDRLIADLLEATETLIKADAIDIECFAAQRNQRIEKTVQSLGKSGRQEHHKGSKGVC